MSAAAAPQVKFCTHKLSHIALEDQVDPPKQITHTDGHLYTHCDYTDSAPYNPFAQFAGGCDHSVHAGANGCYIPVYSHARRCTYQPRHVDTPMPGRGHRGAHPSATAHLRTPSHGGRPHINTRSWTPAVGYTPGGPLPSTAQPRRRPRPAQTSVAPRMSPLGEVGSPEVAGGEKPASAVRKGQDFKAIFDPLTKQEGCPLPAWISVAAVIVTLFVVAMVARFGGGFGMSTAGANAFASVTGAALALSILGAGCAHRQANMKV